MSRKTRATEADVMAFMRALYPESPELAVAAFDEATVLRYAAECITELRERAERAEAELKRLRTDPSTVRPESLEVRET